jgi:hypothetical protein
MYISCVPRASYAFNDISIPYEKKKKKLDSEEAFFPMF